MWIIIAGNPLEGYTYIAPFETREAAEEWAAESIDPRDQRSITQLIAANDDQKSIL